MLRISSFRPQAGVGLFYWPDDGGVDYFVNLLHDFDVFIDSANFLVFSFRQHFEWDSNAK